MNLIQRVTSNPLQTQTLILDDGSSVLFTIYFRPMQYGWFINTLSTTNLTLNGMRIVNSPNMLNQWRNLINFGLACFSDGDREPMLQQDFSSGRSKLYILTAAEVQEYAEYLSLG